MCIIRNYGVEELKIESAETRNRDLRDLHDPKEKVTLTFPLRSSIPLPTKKFKKE